MTIDPSNPPQWLAADWLALRRSLSTMPYSGGIHPGALQIDKPADVLRWLDELRDRLQHVSADHTRAGHDLAEARRVIDAGRTWHAAMLQPVGSPVGERTSLTDVELDVLVLAAVTGGGDVGVTGRVIAAALQRQGVRVDLVTIAESIGRLVGAGRVDPPPYDEGPDRSRYRVTRDEARCPDPECGEPLALIAAGAVGHCGRTCAPAPA